MSSAPSSRKMFKWCLWMWGRWTYHRDCLKKRHETHYLGRGPKRLCANTKIFSCSNLAIGSPGCSALRTSSDLRFTGCETMTNLFGRPRAIGVQRFEERFPHVHAAQHAHYRREGNGCPRQTSLSCQILAHSPHAASFGATTKNGPDHEDYSRATGYGLLLW